jgi:signal transduction histidine kinase
MRRILLAALVVVVLLADALAIVLRWQVDRDRGGGEVASAVRSVSAFAIALGVGVLIVDRRPGNRTGRVLVALGVAFAALSLVEAAARYGLLLDRGPRWLAEATGWLAQWLWIPVIALIGALMLVFPDGRPPGHRWRIVGWGLLVATLSLVGTFPYVSTELADELGTPDNPLAAPSSIRPILGVVMGAGFLLLIASMVGAAASMVFRWRRAGQVERQQIEWVALAAVAFVAALVVNGIADGTDAQRWVSVVADVCLAGIFVAIGIAVLRYRLYDIDLIVNRAIVYGLLAAFITAVYAVVVAGLGALVDARGHLWLSVLTTVVVALAFAPARERARRIANRLVYGETLSPYDALAGLGRRLSGAVATEELLPSLARSAADGVGAASAEVRLHLPDGRARRAAWPPVDDRAPLDVEPLVEPFVVAVTSGADRLGDIALVARPGAAFTARQRALVADLAHQASAPLANVRLTLQLEDQLAHISEQAVELRASRERLVRAQDDERRRLERNIHDGAQQHLVAITLELGAAARKASPPLDAQLDGIRRHVADTLVELRSLARGVFPPLLAEAGVGAALRAHIAATRLAARVDDQLTGRAAPGVEAAIYFCCLEALQNVSKHAPGASVAIVLDASGQLDADVPALTFSVTDDGPGIAPGDVGSDGTGLQGMRDRIAAVGGHVWIDSAPGHGTVVRGVVPRDAAGHVGGARTTSSA